MHNVGNACQDVVSGAGSWHAYMEGEPCDGVTDVGRACLCNPYSVTVVGVPGGANVPPFHAMKGPTAMCIWFDMGQDMCTRWSYGHAVEVKCTMDVCPGGEFWVASATTEEIEGQFHLGKQTVPQVEQEILVSAAEPSNEVIFKGANGTFGGIVLVHVQWDQLVIDVFCSEEIFKGSRGFTIQSVETRL